MANKVKGNRQQNGRINNKNGNNAKGKAMNNVRRTVIKKKVVLRQAVQDARQKILQKKRTSMVDARDVLAKIAKTQDARSKINRLRHDGPIGRPVNTNIKVIGHNIVQKTDRNGQISLSTAKKGKPEMNMAIRKQSGSIQRGPPQRPVVRKVIMKRIVPQQQQQQQPLPRQRQRMVLRNSFNKIDLAPLDARLDRMERLYSASLYKWTNQRESSASQLIGSLEARRPIHQTALLTDSWQQYVPNKKPVRLANPTYIDLDAVAMDEEMPLQAPVRQTILQGPSRSSNIHSRLDTHAAQPKTHGILATKVVVPAGHRIVVSNLQSTVTQDDIKELFEDIGQLLAARLVRSGVAEVIYKNLKDAQKAVDTYHNRQLDGQPMKCLLVNKRPLNHPTAPAFTKQDSRGTAATRNITMPIISNKLVPDIGTIHKVLFQRK